jgi:HSP20 family protein
MITRWDPFRELGTLQDRMNRLFEESWGPGARRTSEESLAMGNFVPPVDVYEDEHAITLKMEVPGIDQKDIDVRVENNVLTVHGERKLEKDEKEENFHRVERRYGSFTRSFTLPNTVDTDNVNADYDNGVLKIRLAKRAEAKPKQIKVNIGQGGQKTIESKGRAA